MSVLDKLKTVLSLVFPPNRPDRRPQEPSADKQEGSRDDRGARRSKSFDEDYEAANRLLRQRMNARFPDNYHARLGSGAGDAYDHGADRARAVDAVSAAISAALRGGASVKQAADAGAASVGL